MDNVLIVGGGVFGQVIAAKLRSEGHPVSVFDRQEKEAGSPPSGGHLKPSWLTAIPKPDLEQSLDTLDTLFGVETLECEFGIHPVVKRMELLRVDVFKVLEAPVLNANVKSVGDGWMELASGIRYNGVVVVAAGVWSGELCPSISHLLSAKKGVSWTFTGGEPVTNMIRPWAPYKQIVRTYHGPGLTWIGDGTAILDKNWSADRERQCWERNSKWAPAGYTEVVKQVGTRPYMIGDGFRQLAPRLWLATGGGKSGMALAGVCANKLAEALR